MVQFLLTWAEDRATVGTDPSADPGAKTEGAAQRAALSFPPFGIGIKALNPRGSGGGSPRAFAPLRLARSYHHGPHYRLVVTVSITGSLAAVLVVRGCTPKHPFVNTSAYGQHSGHADRARSISLRPPRGRGSSQSLARSASRSRFSFEHRVHLQTQTDLAM